MTAPTFKVQASPVEAMRMPPQGVTNPTALDPQVAALSQLLRLEGEVRHTPTAQALCHLMANETRGLVRARQVFVMHGRSGRSLRVVTVSSLAMVDRKAPTIQWIERLLRAVAQAEGTQRVLEFTLPAYADADDPLTASYPFPCCLWVPLWSRSEPGLDGLLLARETPWLDADKRIATRVAETYGHSLELHRSRPSRFKLRLPFRLTSAALVAAVVAAGFIPVPMTALAPLEVVARNPQTVTMPVEGIVQTVLVDSNTPVVAGQPLVHLVDTVARNKLALAEREQLVAAAKLEKASSLSFSDARGRHDLGIARAEMELREAERDYAKTLLDKTSLVAERAGIAVYPNRRDLEGKPLPVGERLMLIVDPGAVELKIDLAVADSVVLQKGARVKAFLDSDPLAPIEAIVTQIDYQARLSDSGIAAYHMVAQFEDGEKKSPQLGVRGTAQLYGPTTFLAIYLLRRPLSSLRQWAGR